MHLGVENFYRISASRVLCHISRFGSFSRKVVHFASISIFHPHDDDDDDNDGVCMCVMCGRSHFLTNFKNLWSKCQRQHCTFPLPIPSIARRSRTDCFNMEMVKWTIHILLEICTISLEIFYFRFYRLLIRREGSSRRRMKRDYISCTECDGKLFHVDAHTELYVAHVWSSVVCVCM